MKRIPVTAIKTKEEARQIARDWQHWQHSHSMSYGESIEWSEYFEVVGLKFQLLAEFRENGII